MNAKNLIILSLLVIAAFSRLIPHAPNFTALGAMALLAGYWLSPRLAVTLPLVVLFITDLVLGGHNTMFFVYGAMALIAVLGLLFKKMQLKTIPTALGGAVSGSVIFYLITNFGVWMSGGLYAQNVNGLIESYVMALPFLKNQMAGDIFFSVVLFGSYELARRFVPALRTS